MIEKLDYSVDMAVALFAQARSPGIYKQDYLNDLVKMYVKDDERDSIQVMAQIFQNLESLVSSIFSLKFPIAPPVPSWKEEDTPRFSNPSTSTGAMRNEEDLDDDEEEGDDSENRNDPEKRSRDGSRPPFKKNPKRKRTEEANINAKFADPKLRGIETCTDLDEIERVRIETQEACGWNGKGFGGAQPVSMDQQNIRLLVERRYQVSWKADGTRLVLKTCFKCKEIF